MKKILALPLFAMAVLVSQASGKVMCLYTSGDCWPGPTAAECNESWGWVFNDGKEGKGTFCEGGTYDKSSTTNRKDQDPPSASGGTPTSKGCCRFAASAKFPDCYDVYTTTEESDCQTGSNTFWSSACPGSDGECPTGTPTYDGGSKSSLGCCKWANTETNPNGKCWDVYDSDEVDDCKTGDNQFWSGKCPDGNGGCPSGTPILKYAHSVALIVAPYGRSLHISSIREATVSLYDMSGVKVYSGKVRAGNSVFGLEKVASGSYYAIVQAGSESKKIPVILK